jgi:hypothetical protein
MKIYLIRCVNRDFEGEVLWWDNRYGWVDLGSASVFTQRERDVYELPIEGAWVEFVSVDENKKGNSK